MKFGIKHFWKETPAIARKAGWACLCLSGAIFATAYSMEIKGLQATAVFTGIAGKFLCDCFAEKK